MIDFQLGHLLQLLAVVAEEIQGAYDDGYAGGYEAGRKAEAEFRNGEIDCAYEEARTAADITAYNEGYNSGYDEGYADGMDDMLTDDMLQDAADAAYAGYDPHYFDDYDDTGLL